MGYKLLTEDQLKKITLEEFKNDLRKHLEENLATRLQRENENNLIEAVVKGSTVEVPNALVEQQLDFFVQDFEYRLAYQGIKLDVNCSILSQIPLTSTYNLFEFIGHLQYQCIPSSVIIYA